MFELIFVLIKIDSGGRSVVNGCCYVLCERWIAHWMVFYVYIIADDIL